MLLLNMNSSDDVTGQNGVREWICRVGTEPYLLIYVFIIRDQELLTDFSSSVGRYLFICVFVW